MANINPQKITGKWLYGFALDVHTTSSIYLGVNEAGHEIYDTKRSEIGELLYRLKYRGDMAAAGEIIDATSKFLAPHRGKFDLIVPVPPSGVHRRSTGAQVMDLSNTSALRPVALGRIVRELALHRAGRPTVIHWLVEPAEAGPVRRRR